MTDQKCELSDEVDDSTRNCHRRHSMDFNYFLLSWTSKDDVLNERWIMYRVAAAAIRRCPGLKIEDNSWKMNILVDWRRWKEDEKNVFFRSFWIN